MRLFQWTSRVYRQRSGHTSSDIRPPRGDPVDRRRSPVGQTCDDPAAGSAQATRHISIELALRAPHLIVSDGLPFAAVVGAVLRIF